MEMSLTEITSLIIFLFIMCDELVNLMMSYLALLHRPLLALESVLDYNCVIGEIVWSLVGRMRIMAWD